MGKGSKLPLVDGEGAVLRLLRNEKPPAALARRFQVSEQTLNRWRDELLVCGRQRLGRKGESEKEEECKIAVLERELDRRTQVIGELTLAYDLYKDFGSNQLERGASQADARPCPSAFAGLKVSGHRASPILNIRHESATKNGPAAPERE